MRDGPGSVFGGGFYWGSVGGRRWGAHPRAYGENCGLLTWLCLRVGSSPRIRGKLVVFLRVVWRAGLIPAHTGKTKEAQHVPQVDRAHPRAYGENQERDTVLLSLSGSSPRIQGILRRYTAKRLLHGLIPAHTGNTCRLAHQSTYRRAHPRAYREYTQPQVATPKQSLKIIYFPHVYIGDE